jgi:hypothetical protein
MEDRNVGGSGNIVADKSVAGDTLVKAAWSAVIDLLVAELCWKYGYIFRNPPLSAYGGNRFYDRIVNPLIYFSVLRGWLDYSRKNHTDSCSVSSQSSLPGLKLIDC